MVFYPAAASIDQASPIEVKAGSDGLFNVSVRRYPRTYSARGRVVTATGLALPTDIRLSLGYQTFYGGGSIGSSRSFDPATGTFQLTDIVPGNYFIQASVAVREPPGAGDALRTWMAEQSMRPFGQVPIHIVDSDIQDLVVVMRAAESISGRVIVEGQPISVLPHVSQFQLSLLAPTVLLQPPSLATVPKPDGTFEVKGIREGEYRVVAPTIFPGFYIKAIRYGADDVLSRPFKFSGTASGTFEVIFRSGAAQVSGTVRDAESKSVTGTQIVLIPTERSRLDLYRTTVTDPNGKFSMSNLTPGDYKLFSWETADMGAQYDPDFLKQYEDQGQSVRIVESSNQNIDVKLIPGQ